MNIWIKTEGKGCVCARLKGKCEFLPLTGEDGERWPPPAPTQLEGFIYLALDGANGGETWLCHKSARLPSSVRTVKKLARVKVWFFNLPQLLPYILIGRFIGERPAPAAAAPHHSTRGCLNGHVQIGVIGACISVLAGPRCFSLAPRLPLRAGVCLKTIWPAFPFLPMQS